MELVMDRWQRRMVFFVIPVLILALVLVTSALLWGDLPHSIATRFHPDGHATSATPKASALVVQLIISVGCAGALVRIGRTPRPGDPVVAATAAFIGMFTGLIYVFIAQANRGHADWHDVDLGAGAIAGALGGATGWTIPVVLLARRIAPTHPWYPNRSIPFGPDERPAWFGRTHSVGFAVAAASMVVLGLVTAVVSQLGVGVVLVVLGVVLAGFTSVDATIDERGIGIRSGVFGWPRVRFPLDLVEEAQRVELRPWSWGGWGYRGSLRLFRRAAWVLRSGDGLQLQLRGGQRFVVSIDDADEAAAVLNGLVARTATARSG